MRRLSCCLAAAGLALAGTAASAQQVYGGPSPFAADFSGVEFGPDFGFGFGSDGALNSSGGTLGGHLGYNFQSSQIVGGVEGDVMGGNLTASTGGPYSFSQHFLSSLRVRGGFAFGQMLGYGTLGVGWATSRYSDPSGSTDATNKGVVYGVGAEYALTRNFSLRAELMRFDFGGQNYAVPSGVKSVNSSTNMLRVGGSLHF